VIAAMRDVNSRKMVSAYLIGLVRKVEGLAVSRSFSTASAFDEAGIRSLFPHPGHLATVPARSSGALIVFWQPGHSTRIIVLASPEKIGKDNAANIARPLRRANASGATSHPTHSRSNERFQVPGLSTFPLKQRAIRYFLCGFSAYGLRRYDAMRASAPRPSAEGVPMI
jgi:hypothetical protein